MKSIQIFVPIVWVFITIQTAFCDIPFSVNPSNYKHWVAITAVVHSFTNENISGTGDVLAAFVGDECRGFATHPQEGTRFFLQAWSNDPGVSNPDGTYTGETISFRFYDAISQTIHMIQEIVPFSAGMIKGSIGSPVTFHLSDSRKKGCIDPKAQNFDPLAEIQHFG